VKSIPRKRVSRARFIFGLTAICLLAVGAYVIIEITFYPWALSLTGAPTLTGRWQGVMTTPTGQQQRVWLHLTHPLPTGKCTNCPRIEGKAITCTANNDRRDYRIWGGVENWRGTHFALKTLDESEHKGKLTLGYIQGKWSADDLDLTTHLNVPGEPVTMRVEKIADGKEVQSIIGGHPDTHEPVHWRMHRSSVRQFTGCMAFRVT
jgi:hypothetical protein